MIRRLVLLVAVGAGLAALWVSGGSTASTVGGAPASVPHVKHVFIVVLENENEASTFGPNSQIPYLAKTMTSQGAFIPNYFGIGHESLDNYISMISGQAPNIATQADCQIYTKFTPGLPASNGQFGPQAR